MDAMPYDYTPTMLPEPVPLIATGSEFSQRCMLVAADAVGGWLKAGDPKAITGRFQLASATDAMGQVEFIAEVHGLHDGMIVFRWLLLSATGRRGNLVAVLRGILGLKAQLKGKHDAIPQGRVLVFDAVQQAVRMLHLPAEGSGELPPAQRVLQGHPLDEPATVTGASAPTNAPQPAAGSASGSPATAAPEATLSREAQQGYAVREDALPAYGGAEAAAPSLPAYDGYGQDASAFSKVDEPVMPSWDDHPPAAPSFAEPVAPADPAPSPRPVGQALPTQVQSPPERLNDPPHSPLHGGDSGPLTAAYQDYQRSRRRSDRTIMSAPPELDPDTRWAAPTPAPQPPAAHLEDLVSAGDQPPGPQDVFPPQAAPVEPRLTHASDRLTVAGEREDYRAASTSVSPAPPATSEDPQNDEDGSAETVEGAPTKRRTGRHVIGLEDVVTDEEEFEQVGFLIPPPTRKKTTGLHAAQPPAEVDEALSSRLAARAKRASNWRNRNEADPYDGPLLGRRPRPRNTDTNPVAKTEVPFGAGARPAAQSEQTDPQLDGPVFETEGLKAAFEVNGKTHGCLWEFVGHTRAGILTTDLGCACQVGDIVDVVLPAEPVSETPIQLRGPIRHVAMRPDGQRSIHIHLKAPNAYVPREYRRVVQFWSLKGRRR